MTLSRTARVLIALLLVAAAAFFWVNFFNQPETQAPVVTQQPVTVPGAASADAATTSPTATGGAQPSGLALDDDAAPPATPATADATAVPPGTTVAPGAAPAVIAPPTVVLRDLVVDDLPFLVTSPPALEEAEAAADAAAGASRPQASKRGSINPFSPVVVQAPPAPAAPATVTASEAPASAEPEIVVVADGSPPITAGGNGAVASPTSPTSSAAPAQVRAPAPRAVAPAPTRVSDLPRPLPSGTLPVTPDILRDARTAPTRASGPSDLAQVAAVMVPESTPTPLPAVTTEAPESAAETSPDAVQVLGPSRPAAAAAGEAPSIPLVVGADTLSRYLRDNDVRFTGTALGPVSVGVFRSKLLDQPVVLTLGQVLPDTEIILADLRGYEAKFSLGDRTHVLSLDIRR